ncbi:MAG: flavin reductase family protein [Paracoccaceae bacterium]|jgi:ferredoxin|nr:flavin reductase family protein [Paracoccaceae bacterium]
MHPDPGDDAPLLLYGAGIGLTPLVAIALDAARRGRCVGMALSARRRADLPLARDLDALAGMGAHVSLRIVETGAPDAARMTCDVLDPTDPEAQAFLCRPPAFVAQIGEGLVGRGLPRHRIHGESFASSAPRATEGAETWVRFAELDGPRQNRGETLMETAEAAGLVLPSGCRAGSCGICITRLAHGQVRYLEPVAPPSPEHVHLCVAAPDGPVTLGPLGDAGGAAMPDWREADLVTLFDRTA